MDNWVRIANALDGSDRIAELEAEVDWLRDELEQERQRRRDDLIGQQYGDERLAELQALIDAYAAARASVRDYPLDSPEWEAAMVVMYAARDALLAAASIKDTPC